MKWWQILGIFALGVLVGFLITFPTKFEIKFEVVNETMDWWETQYTELENLTYHMKNMCCFPSNCEQAKNNPDLCTCVYMVECFEE